MDYAELFRVSELHELFHQAGLKEQIVGLQKIIKDD